MTRAPKRAELQVDASGNLLIPAVLCHALGMEPGETFIAHEEDGRIVVETQESLLTRLKALFAGIPATVSLSDELIAEPREAATREQTEITSDLHARRREADSC